MKKGKVGRNDLCPCGSGLKYKKCCINKLPVENIMFGGALSDNEMCEVIIDKCDKCGKVGAIFEVQFGFIGDKTSGETKHCIECAEFL